MRALLKRLWGDQSGTSLTFFALTLLVLLLAIGGAIDVGVWLSARDKTLAAVDAAVLAGARTLQTSKDEAAAIATAQNVYNTNVSSRMPVMNDLINFAVVDNGQAVVATGTAEIGTYFLKLADINTLPLMPVSAAEIAKAEFLTGNNGDPDSEPESLEISLMLDVTGSMGGTKLDDLKAAATDLVNIVLWEGQVDNPSKIALVPFSEDIRLPTTARDAARGTGWPSRQTLSSYSSSKTYYLSDCVVERVGTHAYTDAVPDAGQYVMAHYSSSYTGSGSNKKGKCTVSDAAEIVPLSADKAMLIGKIDDLSASGGTAGHLGSVWAWYTLSPYWSTLWDDPENRPQAYDTENLTKIAILMTDGEYNTEYDSHGVKAGSTGAGSAANGDSATQARALCTAMKNKNIIVYAVGFDLSGETSQSYQTLYECASEPKSDHFYNATDGTQLKNAFRDIAISISAPLYLSK